MSADKTIKVTGEMIAEEISADMKRVGVGTGRVSVEMTHTQYAAIVTALCLASCDSYIGESTRAEYAKVRELMISAPIVGLSD